MPREQHCSQANRVVALLFLFLFFPYASSTPPSTSLICFSSTSTGNRGVQVSLFDYMHYTETLLGYRTLLLLPSSVIEEHQDYPMNSSLEKFTQRFQVVFYTIEAHAANDNAVPELSTAAVSHNCQMLYIQASGAMEDKPRFPHSFHLHTALPLAVHAVFQYQPYGTAYAAISDWLLDKPCPVVVPLIVSPPPPPPPVKKVSQQRQQLYPFMTDNTLVVCRHGGLDTFNLDIAQQAVGRAAGIYAPSDLQFLFLNTFPFMDASPSVHFLPSIVDMTEKEDFFALCDVMLHARYDGESFGLAVAEMSVRNKPVLTFLPPEASPAYRTHIRHLGEKGFYYTTGEELDALLKTLVMNGVVERDYNAYREFSPEKVMMIFENVFIKPCLSKGEKVSPGVLLFNFHHVDEFTGHESESIRGSTLLRDTDMPHYVFLQQSLHQLCEAGGSFFQAAMFQAGGSTCVSQVLDIFVEMILKSDVLVPIFLSKRIISTIQLLLQNEGEVVASGVLDGHHTRQYLGNVSSALPLVDRAKVAIILVLPQESVEQVLQNKLENSLLTLLQTTLAPVVPFWPAVSVYVGVEKFGSMKAAIDMKQYFTEIVESIIPSSAFNALHIEIIDGDRSFISMDTRHKEVVKFLMICELGELASKSGFDYYIFLPETVHFQKNEKGYNIFSALESVVLNDRLGKEKSSLNVWNEISLNCALSYQTIATCQDDAIFILSHSHFALFNGHLVLSPMKRQVQQFIQEHEDIVLTSNALVLFFIDLKKPFHHSTFIDAVPSLKSSSTVQECHSSGSLKITPSLRYINEIMRTRMWVRQKLLADLKSLHVSSFVGPLMSRFVRRAASISLKYSSANSVFFSEVCHAEEKGSNSAFSICEFRKRISMASNTTDNVPSGDGGNSKIAFISAAVGETQSEYPKLILQSIDVDFILFTNSKIIMAEVALDPENLWTIDSHAYHLDSSMMGAAGEQSRLPWTPTRMHSFYKSNFYLFSRLKSYNYIVWLEPTITIHSEDMARVVIRTLDQSDVNVAAFEYSSSLENIFAESDRDKYVRIYSNDSGDLSAVAAQFSTYTHYGYSSDIWSLTEPYRPLYGHWCTDFLAYNMRNFHVVSTILAVWDQQLAEFPPAVRVHDAISFAFVVQMILVSNHLNFTLASLPSTWDAGRTKKNVVHNNNHSGCGEEDICGSWRMNSMYQNKVNRVWKFI